MLLSGAAYDTEAVYPWRENGNPDFDCSPPRIREFQAGVRAVPDAHLEREIPATFFLLANMLEAAGPELRSILDQPLFGIQSHSFTQYLSRYPRCTGRSFHTPPLRM